MKRTMMVQLGAGDLKALMRGDGIPLTIRGFDEVVLGYDRQRHHNNGAAPPTMVKKHRKNRKYSKRFKTQVMSALNVLSIPQAAEKYNVPYKTIDTWVRKLKKKPK